MAKAGSCMFRIGYFFYTRTRIGLFYHRREITKSHQKFPDGQGHSIVQVKHVGDVKVVPVPMLEDNYAYLVTDKDGMTVVIDPGDPEPVQKVLQEMELTPSAILITHKHWDHSGGNSSMKQHFHNVPVYGGTSDHIPDVTNPVGDGDVLVFGSMKLTVKLTPGHTIGHVIYILDGESHQCADSIFSGDHLFLAGCGRMFEGTPATMLKSLDSMLELKGDSMIWPGHEYADDNLKFSTHLEPENEAAKQKLQWVQEQRDKNLCTCPSTINEEKSYNPFLRTSEESILRALAHVEMKEFERPSEAIRAEALVEIRERKDQFKYKL